MTVHVRPATEGDWPRLWPLLQGMGSTGDEDSSEARFRRLARDPTWLIVVAEDEDSTALAGYAAAQDHGEHLRAGHEGRIARLHDLFVDPAQRRSGVGTSLVAAVVEWAEQRVRYLQWQAHETTAAPFYERLGYRGQPCPQPDYPEFEITFSKTPP